MAKLTNQRELFASEYIIDLNATQAAVRAGYSEKTAQEQGSRLLSIVMVQDKIRQLQKERAEKQGWDAKKVLERIIGMVELDVADILDDGCNLLPVKQWPQVWRKSISSIEITEMGGNGDTPVSILKKIKWPDKLKNIELLGKHVDIKAFGDKPTDSGNMADVMRELMNRMPD